ncbi:hypothetical protein ACFOY2_32275 [Nonomuraea purpurea]|uniref:Uncharacterized protein n=1 Tax=Nonomuraea purpurea TaxID=1849276 RepID=A0ABV8GGI3_9ACTN
MNRTTLPTALLALVVLSGCGGAAENAATPSPSGSPTAAKDKKHQFEAAKADCMKQKGFKYVPYVKPDRQLTEEQRQAESGDYQAMLKHRKKYGFEIFAQFVYPKEPGSPEAQAAAGSPNPNLAIREKLSDTQHTAYLKVMDSCMSAAGKQVLGIEIKSVMDWYNQTFTASKQTIKSELDSDPKLIELGGAMATCLKSKGYTVTNAAPTALSVRGREEFMALEDKLGREQRGDVPDKPTGGGEKEYARADLTPAQAKPHLAKETKSAVDDLECGKDFYLAYLPRETAIRQRVHERYAM